jgi:predicted DNA-binding transcriptional regulator AlpA
MPTDYDPSSRRKPSVADLLRDFDSLPDCAHARVQLVAALYATSVTNIWRWAKAGRIPAPKKLGPQTTAWSVGELRRDLAAKAEAA